MKLNIHITTYAKIEDIVQSVGMSTLGILFKTPLFFMS